MTNRETVEGLYARLASGDLPALLEGLDPEVSWTLTAGLPDGDTYRGRYAVGAILAGFAEQWDELRVVPGEYFPVEDNVVVLGHYLGVSRNTGSSALVRFAHVWRLRDGLVRSFETIMDTRTMVDALG